METSSTQPFLKSSWRLPARLLAIVLLLMSGPWLAGEFANKPSKVEAKQMRAETETLWGLMAAGRFRDADHAGLEYVRKWERYQDYDSQLVKAMKTHAELDAEYDMIEGQHGTQNEWATKRASAAEFLSNLPVDWPRPRSVAIPTLLFIVGLALIVATYRR